MGEKGLILKFYYGEDNFPNLQPHTHPCTHVCLEVLLTTTLTLVLKRLPKFGGESLKELRKFEIKVL